MSRRDLNGRRAVLSFKAEPKAAGYATLSTISHTSRNLPSPEAYQQMKLSSWRLSIDPLSCQCAMVVSVRIPVIDVLINIAFQLEDA